MRPQRRGRPRKSAFLKRAPVSLLVQPELRSWLVDQAKQNRLSITRQVETLLLLGIEAQEDSENSENSVPARLARIEAKLDRLLNGDDG
jgi:hypothetical protein